MSKSLRFQIQIPVVTRGEVISLGNWTPCFSGTSEGYDGPQEENLGGRSYHRRDLLLE